MNKEKKNIFLIGFMGAGKSTSDKAKAGVSGCGDGRAYRKRTGNADQQNFRNIRRTLFPGA